MERDRPKPLPTIADRAPGAASMVVLRTNGLTSIVKHYLGRSELSFLTELRCSHVQTSVYLCAADSDDFSDRRGGLRDPGNFFGCSTALVDKARARPAAQAAI